MQEDKEAIFDGIETVKKCLSIFAPMISTMTALKENMYKAAGEGFINATDLADYLVKKGMPFRTAYKHVGEIVAYCIKENLVLENVPIEKYKEFDETSLQPVFFVTWQFFIPQSYEELVDSIQAFKENLKYHIDKAYEKNVGNILDVLE